MAKCEFCGKDMKRAKGCNIEAIRISSSKLIRRLKHDGQERCGDCNAMPGHYHHPGCDIEKCPKCGNQLISCDCTEHDYDDDEVVK